MQVSSTIRTGCVNEGVVAVECGQRLVKVAEEQLEAARDLKCISESLHIIIIMIIVMIFVVD